MPEEKAEKEVQVLRKGVIIHGYECVQTKAHGAVVFHNGVGSFPESIAQACIADGLAIAKPEKVVTPPEAPLPPPPSPTK